MPKGIKSILIHTTEEKHRELRLIKATFDMSWEELLVDYFLDLMIVAQEKGRKEMEQKYYEDLKRRLEAKEKAKHG